MTKNEIDAPMYAIDAALDELDIARWSQSSYGKTYEVYDVERTDRRLLRCIASHCKSTKTKRRVLKTLATAELARNLTVAPRRKINAKWSRATDIIAGWPLELRDGGRRWLMGQPVLTPSVAQAAKLRFEVSIFRAKADALAAKNVAERAEFALTEKTAETVILKLGELDFADDQRVTWKTETGSLRNPSGNKYHCARFIVETVSGVLIDGEYDRREGWFVYHINGIESPQCMFDSREILCAKIQKLFEKNRQR